MIMLTARDDRGPLTAREDRDRITPGGFWPVIEGIVDYLAELATNLTKRFGVCDERHADHETRIAALEQRPELRYCGVWDAGAEYREGNLVTHHGSLWAAKTTSESIRPGEGGISASAWQLAIKRGRDGKDAQDA